MRRVLLAIALLAVVGGGMSVVAVLSGAAAYADNCEGSGCN